MADGKRTTHQDRTLGLLKALGLARTPEQQAAYRTKLDRAEAGKDWAKIRERLGLPARTA